MRRQQPFAVIGLIMCLAVAACTTTAHGSAASPTANPSVPSLPSTAPAVAPTAATSTPTTATTRPAGSSTTKSTTSPIAISESLSGPGDIITTHCPYTVTVTAEISVNHGPTSVTYEWKSSDGTPPVTSKITFAGAGPQSRTLTAQQRLSGVNVPGGEELIVYAPDGKKESDNTTSFKLVCGATADTPVATPSNGTCGYTAEFSTNLHSLGPQDVTYQWVFSDGTTKSGDVDFTSLGAAQATISTSHTVGLTSLLKPFTATLHITSAGGFVTGPVHPGCRPVKAP
jgi:hypothetical protein